MELPTPRLELRWTQETDNWFRRICTYALVLPLGEHDIRRGTEDGKQSELRVVFSTTTVSGGSGNPPIYDDSVVDTPFRDHSHALWDSKALGDIPIYAVCGDTYTRITDR